MGHRAEKNRLAHGYLTTCSGRGLTMTYRTERPPYVAGKGKASNRSRNSYANVGTVERQEPKRKTWAPRHRGAA